MDRIKYSMKEEISYAIDRNSFEQKTGMSAPYYEDVSNPTEGGQYAVCPACNNPVQIIGLYKRSAHTQKPFAKHFPSSIKNLAPYIQENYEYCPLRSNRTKHGEYAKRAKANALTQSIIQRLLTSFDKIIYFWESQIGISISDNLAQKMLKRYFDNQGYLFYDASLGNVPLVFVHASFPAHALYGRIVFHEAFRQALQEAHPQIAFDENHKLISRDGQFLEVMFSFMNHQIHHSEEGMYETLKLVVSTRKPNHTEVEMLYAREIRFDMQQYQDFLINIDKKMTAQKESRSQRLLKLAQLYAEYS